MFEPSEISSEGNSRLHLLRTTRMEDRVMEEQLLGAHEIQQLAEQNLGLFAGGYRTIERMERQITQLAGSSSGQSWAVAFATRDLFKDTLFRLREQDLGRSKLTKVSETCTQLGSLPLTTVEGLPNLRGPARLGIILFDPSCMVHKARRYVTYDGQNHDRPQFVANALANLRTQATKPLLLLLTLKPPKSVGTAHIARTYMLDGWWFAEPTSLRFTECSGQYSSAS